MKPTIAIDCELELIIFNGVKISFTLLDLLNGVGNVLEIIENQNGVITVSRLYGLEQVLNDTRRLAIEQERHRQENDDGR